MFGRGKVIDASEMKQQLQERQDTLIAQLQEIESSKKKGGGGRFLFGILFGGALAGVAYYLSDDERRKSVLGAASSLTGGADDGAERDQAVNTQVESTLFSDSTLPKDQININTVDGVVYVRGTVASKEQIDEIERRVKGVTGVDAVINLLRLPTPAK
jgi:hypothetical protein